MRTIDIPNRWEAVEAVAEFFRGAGLDADEEAATDVVSIVAQALFADSREDAP